MAREVAVDVASHSPQVDPILDELADVLADLSPMTPEVPYYSATLFDPRERPCCDAEYWVDNLRHTVRFAAAVQAALEDGYRVFAELAPHPLLTHAVEQTARSLDMPLAALAGMRREQPLPHGLRGFLADLHSAGAAVDFSVLYPSGRLVDAPLPTWTHRQLMLESRRPGLADTRRLTVSVHPLLGAHVRLQEEPERHVWQAEVGTEAQPWLGDHQIHTWPRFPGPPTARWRWPPPAPSSAKSPRSATSASSRCCCWTSETTVGAVASVEAPGVVDFAVETDQDGEHVRRASRGPARRRGRRQPPAHDMAALLAAHPRRVGRRRAAESLRRARYPVRSGVHRSGRRAHRRRQASTPCWPKSRCPARSARSRPPTASTPPCWMHASSRSRPIPMSRLQRRAVLLLPLGVRRLRAYGPARNARYCYARVTEPTPPASRPTSMCWTSTARSC